MTYQTEFPDFASDTMPPIPQGFVDQSWSQDTCPTFVDETRKLTLWVDFADTEAREHPDSTRFTLCRYGFKQGQFYVTDVYATDDWQEIIQAIASAE